MTQAVGRILKSLPSKHWRLARHFVLALLLVTGGATALHLTTLLQDRANSMTRYVRVDVWAVQQAEYELQRFRTTLARHVAGDPEVAMRQVKDRLAGARSTLRLLQRGPDYEQYRLLVDIDRTADKIRSSLDQVEDLLAERPQVREDLAFLRRAEQLLSSPLHALRQMSVDMAHIRIGLQDGDLETMHWLTGINRWMLIGFFAVAAVFIALLLGETRAAKRAERAAGVSEKHSRFLAEHDLLTGLPNRLSFWQLLKERIHRAQDRQGGLVLHLLDLDGFKDINDSFGHDFGDALLTEVARRLTRVIGEDGVLVRLDGDEFAAIRDAGTDMEDRAGAAEALLAVLNPVFELQGRKVQIDASIGVAGFPDDGRNAEALLNAAELALQGAKKEGGHFLAYQPEMKTELQQRRKLEEDLRQAISKGQLEVFFQPQVDLADERCIGAEALVRWRHPERGMVGPDLFIPVAEETGLILPLGRWVLESACRQALDWHGEAADGVVAVNVSPSQFKHEDIVGLTREVLDRTGLSPARLELEITEGMLMHDEQAAIETLEELHALGVQLAIDDFGTGYSSLSYLKRFNVDKLKIDQSFIRDMEQDRGDQMIVRAVIELGSSLGLRTIAEGIENAEQMDLLFELGCHEGQGFFFGRPMPHDEFHAWLQSRTVMLESLDAPELVTAI